MKLFFLTFFLFLSTYIIQAQDYTTAEIKTIHTNKTAAEGDIYHDSELDIFYLGESSGSLIILTTGTLNPNNLGVAHTSDYTLQASDHGSIIEFDSSTDVNLTVPTGLPPGFQVSITQLGDGQVIILGQSGLTINNPYFLNRTSRKFSKVGIEISSTNLVILSGDVQ